MTAKRLPFVFLAVSLSLCSCPFAPEQAPTSVTGGIAIALRPQTKANARTILPAFDMAPAYYDISGTGPSGASFLQTDYASTNFTKDGLALGSWLISVDAKNADKAVIGSGSSGIDIISGQNAQGTVIILPLSGTGGIDVSISWPAGLVASPSIAALIEHPDSSSQDIGSSFMLAGDGLSATYSAASLATGYHFLSLVLKDGSDERIWRQESVRIVKDTTTDANFALSADDIKNIIPKPVFSLESGAYAGTRSVGIGCAVSGTAIIYTNNGSAPSRTNGIAYSGPIAVNSTQTLKAFAYRENWSDSFVAKASYEITGTTPVPSFDLAPGVYFDPIDIPISCAAAGADILFTTDGNDPKIYGNYYAYPVRVNADTVIRTIAVDSGGTVYSNETSAAYRITGHVAPPTFSIDSGSYTAEQTVSLDCATPSRQIRYTLDGSAPTATDGTVYTVPISISRTTTLKAAAFRADWDDSPVVSKTYTLNIPAPTFDPAGGTYNEPIFVAISTNFIGSSIVYSVDGTNPTLAYTSPVAITKTATLKAKVVSATPGWGDSAIAESTYTLQCLAPTFDPEAGAYVDASFLVTFTRKTNGSSIIYTTDGSDPSPTNGTYGMAYTVTAPTTIKAISVKTGWSDSAITEAVFTPNSTAVSPVNGATIHTAYPVVDFPKKFNATNYHVQICTDTDYSTIVAESDILEVSAFTAQSPLVSGAAYHWRWRAFADGAWGYWKVGGTFSFGDSITMTPVAGGIFNMGSNDGEVSELPVHTVGLSSFYISKYEITQDQYQLIAGMNPSYYWDDVSRPVEQVSWYDAIEFCNLLSVNHGLSPVYSIANRNPSSGHPIISAIITADHSQNGYRLPTEAEWEYAARGGAQSSSFTYSGSNDVEAVAWYNGNSGNITHPIGTKTPNELGIYDMSGNVWEWCWDLTDVYSSANQYNPTGAASSTSRALRGGVFNNTATYARSTLRASDLPGTVRTDYGFRIVRSDTTGSITAKLKITTSIDGISLSDSTPLVDWEDVPGVQNYEIRMAVSEAALSSTTATTTVSSHYQCPEFANETTVFWLVRALMNNGFYTDWTSVKRFSIDLRGSASITLSGSLLEDYSATFTVTSTQTLAAPDATGTYPLFTIPQNALPITVSVTSNPTAQTFQWLLDGAEQATTTASIDLSTLAIQNHHLTIMLKKDGDPFRSATIILRTTE